VSLASRVLQRNPRHAPANPAEASDLCSRLKPNHTHRQKTHIHTFKMPGFSQANELKAWTELAQHHKTLSKDIVLKEYFAKDPKRFEKFSRIFQNEADGGEILFDFSKNFLTDETLELLVKLAKESNLEQLRDEMFAGDKINFTEGRAVYHVALRNTSNSKMEVDGKSVVDGVNEVLEHMKEFSEQVCCHTILLR
jgi:glucose-6-phosphate isomerase